MKSNMFIAAAVASAALAYSPVMGFCAQAGLLSAFSDKTVTSSSLTAADESSGYALRPSYHITATGSEYAVSATGLPGTVSGPAKAPAATGTDYAAYSSSILSNAADPDRTATSSEYVGSTVMLPRFERIGYEFLEWNSNKDGSGESWSAGEELDISRDLTLYALWEKDPDIATPSIYRRPAIFIIPDTAATYAAEPDDGMSSTAISDVNMLEIASSHLASPSDYPGT